PKTTTVAPTWRGERSRRCAALELLEGGPGERQVLLADAGEVDHRLGLVAVAGDVDDHALAERGVFDVVADPQAELVRVGRCGRLAGPHRGLDDPVAVLVGCPLR